MYWYIFNKTIHQLTIFLRTDDLRTYRADRTRQNVQDVEKRDYNWSGFTMDTAVVEPPYPFTPHHNRAVSFLRRSERQQ